MIGSVVLSYGLEGQQEQVFRRILEDVSYPIGRGRTESESLSCWCDLIRAVNEGKGNEKSESKAFCERVRSLLTREGLVSALHCVDSLQELVSNETQRLAGKIKFEDSESGNTLMSIRTEINWQIGQDNSDRKVVRLLGALARRLVVCLPTPTEIFFWKLKEERSSRLPSNFGCFERSLDDFLLKMRYMIRNDGVGSSKELMEWMNGFVDVYRRFPVSLKKVKGGSKSLLDESISRLGLSKYSHGVPILNAVGEAILAAQGPYESRRVKKPFIVIGNTNSGDLELVERYLVSGLGWPVHVVSAKDLRDSEKEVVLGESWSWEGVKGQKKVNKGWLLDTFMEVVKGEEPEKEESFFDNILLIKDSDRLLDKERISDFEDIGEPLSNFINNLVHENCMVMDVPYLGIEVNVERLITIMVTAKECVLPGVSTIETGSLVLSPSLVLNFSEPRQIVKSTPFKERKSSIYQNPSRVVFEESIPQKSPSQETPREEECMQIIRSFFEGQGRPDDRDIDIYGDYLIGILSGNDEFCPDDFDCPHSEKLKKGKYNFFKSESSDSLKELIYGYLRKHVSAEDFEGESVF